MLMPWSRKSAHRSLSVSQNTVAITFPADFITFSSLATVAQGGSTGATRSCSQEPSEKPASRPRSKIDKANLLGPRYRVQNITRRLVCLQICPCSGFGIWAFVFMSIDHTEHEDMLDMLKREWFRRMHHISTLRLSGFGPTLMFIHHQMTHFFHVFFRHCSLWTTAAEIIFNARSQGLR